jgi:hypothetical protein
MIDAKMLDQRQLEALAAKIKKAKKK